MLKISRICLAAAALGCLAIAAASVSLADDRPTATPPAQPAPSALDPAGITQPPAPAASATTEQPKTDQPPASAQPALDSQPSASSSTSHGSDAAKSKASSANQWPAPRRYDPNNPQGGSLGVNIVGDNGGIVITSVRSGTPAQQMGLRRGDRLKSVNGQPIEAVDQFISMIRNMNAGDQVEIEIIRDDAPNKLSGKLEAFRQALARGTDPNSDNEPGMSRSDRFSSRLDNTVNPNVQTSYEERNQSSRQSSGDVESRLMNLEQQLSKLQQDIAEIRTSIGNRPSTSTSSLQTPAAGAIGNPTPSAPSVLQSTPGQPPSTK